MSRRRDLGATVALMVACAAPVACGGSVQTTPKPATATSSKQAPVDAKTKDAVPPRAARAELPPAKQGGLDVGQLDPRQAAQAAIVGSIVRGGVASIGFGRRREGLEPRDQVDPVGFRVADLPIGRVPKPLVVEKAPASIPVGGEPTDLIVDWRGTDPSASKTGFVTVRLAIAGEPRGRLRVGTNEANLTGSASGVYVTCGSTPGARPMILPARWETVARAGDELRYTVTDAWFDARECRGHLVGRTTVQARRLSQGLLYAFRACDGTGDACGGEALTFIGPRAQMVSATGIDNQARSTLGAFSFVVLPLKRGAAGAFVERVTSSSLKEWYQMTGTEARFERDIVLGVDVVQGVEDKEPVAIAYASESG